MALRAAGTWTWDGSASTTFTDYDNWTQSISGAGAGDYPGWDNSEGGGTNVDGDTVILTGDVTNGCATAGGYAADKGKLAKFIVTDSYTGAVGKDAANPLVLKMSATGEALIEGTLADDIFLSGNATDEIELVTVLDLQAGKVLTLGGNVGVLNLLKGQVTTQATLTVENTNGVNVGYVSDATNDATLILTAGTTLTGGVVNAMGGTITNSINATIATVTIGKAKWTNTVGTSGVITNLNLYGGQMLWNSGDITTAQVYDGTLNCSNGTEARTCTDLYQYTPATVNVNDGRRWVTITNWHLMCESPRIKVVPGQVIAVTGA